MEGFAAEVGVLGVLPAPVLMQLCCAGVGRVPHCAAHRCVPMHCPSPEPPEEHDGLHPVLQCHGSHLLQRVHVRGGYRHWGSLFAAFCSFLMTSFTPQMLLGLPRGAPTLSHPNFRTGRKGRCGNSFCVTFLAGCAGSHLPGAVPLRNHNTPKSWLH